MVAGSIGTETFVSIDGTVINDKGVLVAGATVILLGENVTTSSGTDATVILYSAGSEVGNPDPVDESLSDFDTSGGSVLFINLHYFFDSLIGAINN